VVNETSALAQVMVPSVATMRNVYGFCPFMPTRTVRCIGSLRSTGAVIVGGAPAGPKSMCASVGFARSNAKVTISTVPIAALRSCCTSKVQGPVAPEPAPVPPPPALPTEVPPTDPPVPPAPVALPQPANASISKRGAAPAGVRSARTRARASSREGVVMAQFGNSKRRAPEIS